jgi:valyl-tRNA synthetase
VGRSAFVDEVRRFELHHRARVQHQLDRLGIGLPDRRGRTDSTIATKAARTAFVRLYDEGLLERAERVQSECPRCQTVVDRLDCEAVELEGEQLLVRLPYDDGDGDLIVSVAAPELLPGVVAVAVPEGHEGVDRSVRLPIGATSVPVVADRARELPEPVVPAHDEDDLELARELGLVPVEVLDGAGVVRAPGPFDGLPRYAARVGARELFATLGALVASGPILSAGMRCRRCGIVTVPRLGARWSLDLAPLEAAVADQVGQGALSFSDPADRELLLERVGQTGPWCLSHQVWAGHPVPVSSCLDCGQLAVSVDPGESCGKCMGPLAPEGDVLDARFVGALWPLVSAGWPDVENGPADCAPFTTVFVDRPGVGGWALPMAALGLRLTGRIPFARVAVHPLAGLTTDDASALIELDGMLAGAGARVVRAALAWAVAAGLEEPDLDVARGLVAAVDCPAEGDTDIEPVVEGFRSCFEDGNPTAALSLLRAVLDDGVAPGSTARLQALAAPILGD